MNLRDLMNKIAEAEAPVDPARAQYDQFKADDAKAAAVAAVKKLTQPTGMGNFIDPKDGIVKWQEQTGMGTPGGIKEFPYDWYKKGQEKQFFDTVTAAGLKLVPVDRKNLFGTSQVVGVEGGAQAIASLGQQPSGAAAGSTTAQGAADAQGNALAQQKLKQLIELIGKLKKNPAQAVKEGVDIEIANMLIESFGYTPEQIDELSMQDVGDFGRGAWQGATLGTGSNIAAGAKSLFKGTKYKDELAGELAADKEASSRSPWAYGAGNVAGAIGSSFAIPGAGVGNLAARGAAKMGAGAAGQALAKGATMVGTNLALQKGIDTAVGAHNKDVLGTQKPAGAKAGTTDPRLSKLQKVIGAKADGIMGPETKQKLAAWQQAQGIKADGIPGPETYGKAGIRESAVDQYARLRDMLSVMEAEQETDEGIASAAASLGKNFLGGLKGWNVAGQTAAKGAVDAAGKKIGGQALKATGAERLANTAGKKIAGAGTAVKAGAGKVAGAVARNPVKTALGTAAGAYGLSQLGGGDADAQNPSGAKPGATTGKQPGAADATGGSDIDQDVLAQIHVLMADLAQFDNPEIQQGLATARQQLAAALGDPNIGSLDKQPATPPATPPAAK